MYQVIQLNVFEMYGYLTASKVLLIKMMLIRNISRCFTGQFKLV